MVFKRCLALLSLMLSLLVSLPVWAAVDVVKPDQAFQLSLAANNDDSIVAHFKIQPGYHLYKERIKFEAEPNSGTQIDPITLPQGVMEHSKFLGDFEVYNNDFDVIIPLKATQNGTASIKVSYQGCRGELYCFAPTTRHFKIALLGPHFSNHYENLLAQHNFWLLALSFFGIGILLAFTPCVLPMLPILSGIILGHKHHLSTSRALTLTSVYILSMSLTYAVAGVFAGLAGDSLQAKLQNPYVLTAFSLVFVLLALSLFGLYELQLPKFLLNRINALSNRQQSGNYLSVAIMGCLSTLIVSPCVSAPLAGALAYISSTGNALLGGTALFIMGLGMGVPLIIVATLGGKYLPKSGDWMNIVKIFFGILMLGMAIYISSRFLPTLVTSILCGLLLIGTGIFIFMYKPIAAFKRQILWKTPAWASVLSGAFLAIGPFVPQATLLSPIALNTHQQIEQSAFKKVYSLDELNVELANAKKSGKPAILDYYADWCQSCKEMDFSVFGDAKVKKLLSQFVLIRADITADSNKTRELSKKFAVFAPPSIVFFDKNNKLIEEAKIDGAVSTKEFTNIAEKALNKS